MKIYRQLFELVHVEVVNWYETERSHMESRMSRKLSFFGHIVSKSRDCLEKEIVKGTMPVLNKSTKKTTNTLTGQRRNMDTTVIGGSIEDNRIP